MLGDILSWLVLFVSLLILFLLIELVGFQVLSPLIFKCPCYVGGWVFAARPLEVAETVGWKSLFFLTMLTKYKKYNWSNVEFIKYISLHDPWCRPIILHRFLNLAKERTPTYFSGVGPKILAGVKHYLWWQSIQYKMSYGFIFEFSILFNNFIIIPYSINKAVFFY